MDAAHLTHPVVVVHSWAGRVATWYLLKYGSDRLAGINFVNAITVLNPKFFGSAVAVGVASNDFQSNIDTTIDVLRACFETQPDEADFRTMIAYNMVVTPQTHKNLGGIKLETSNLWPTLHLPVLVTQGDKDRLVLQAMAEYTSTMIPGAELSVYPGSGHSPYWEKAPRYNVELAQFVRSVQR